MAECAFCKREEFSEQIITASKYFFVIQARRPLSKGHIIIFPKVHINSFELPDAQSVELIKLLETFRTLFIEQIGAQGVNTFSNIGIAAGQTIPHLHIHMITRFDNESENPFAILNSKQKYKELKTLSPEEIEDRKKIYTLA
jgi:diadenosine tetraphosphate (Ap4A) HIT family hydrolase